MKQILRDIEFGVHTFELSQTLTKKQFDAIHQRCCARGGLIPNETKKEYRTLRDPSMPGITVTLYPIRSRNAYRVSVRVEPCRVLGSKDPTALYSYSQKSYRKLEDICNRYLEQLCIPGELCSIPVSRCDLTCNLVFRSQDIVDAYLRLLKKSCLIPSYRAVKFNVHEKKAKDPKRANKYSHCIQCRQATFLCYDKIDQLKMIGRCPKEWDDCFILRLEAQLKCPALKRHLDKETLEDNLSLLKAASEHALPVISSYLTRMFPCTAPHLRHENAVSAVMKNVKKERLREQMLFLLRKTSDGAGLDTAAQKLREVYTDVNNKRLKKILYKFKALNVNPITLLNAGKLKSLPYLGIIMDVKHTF